MLTRPLILAVTALTVIFTLIGFGVTRAGDTAPLESPYVVFNRRQTSGDFVGYAMTLRGHDVQRLTWRGGPVRSPMCAPDGGLLAFMTDDGQVHSITRDGTPLHPVALPPFEHAAQVHLTSVTNDGARALLVAPRPGSLFLDAFVLDLTTGDLTMLPRDIGGYLMPVFAPTGDRIAVTIARSTAHSWQYVPALLDLSGGWLARLGQRGYSIYAPDGNLTIFPLGETPFLLDHGRGRRFELVSANFSLQSQPAWSPDGRYIAHNIPAGHPGNFAIEVLRVDGRARWLLSDVSASSVTPCFLDHRPDGLIE